MMDDERITDADLAARVAAHDAELAKLLRARLRRLRLRAIVAPARLPPVAAAVSGGAPRH